MTFLIWLAESRPNQDVPISGLKNLSNSSLLQKVKQNIGLLHGEVNIKKNQARSLMGKIHVTFITSVVHIINSLCKTLRYVK